MSRTTDRFRPPSGKPLIESPRQCVFAGSVNHSSYLRDDSGGGRFWPVACGRIDIDRLARDRDQLWAEAKARFERGCVWWLETTELVDIAAVEQADRYEGDPWEEVMPAGRKTVEAFLSARCFLVAWTSRRRCGHKWIRTGWYFASGRSVGSIIASAREPNWSGATEGSSNKMFPVFSVLLPVCSRCGGDYSLATNYCSPYDQFPS